MFAILKNHRGRPVALFEVERETPKRIYGRLADTLQRDSWFWLTGFTKRKDGGSFAIKEIVLCYLNSDNAWHQMKDELYAIEAKWNSVNVSIQGARNEAMEKARVMENDNNKASRDACLEEIEKYVCKADML